MGEIDVPPGGELRQGCWPVSSLPPSVRPVAFIREHVARRFGARPGELVSRRQSRRVVEARHAAMFLARRLTGKSFPQIGAAFGGRDHSTIMNAIAAMERRIDEDPGFGDLLGDLEAELHALLRGRTDVEETAKP